MGRYGQGFSLEERGKMKWTGLDWIGRKEGRKSWLLLFEGMNAARTDMDYCAVFVYFCLEGVWIRWVVWAAVSAAVQRLCSVPLTIRAHLPTYPPIFWGFVLD